VLEVEVQCLGIPLSFPNPPHDGWLDLFLTNTYNTSTINFRRKETII
jgi:hypothetical protein